MRLIFVLSAAAVVATATPALARDYKWCARTVMNPSGDCSFDTHRQCLATVSGHGGSCNINPRFAHGHGRYAPRTGGDNH